MGFKIMLLLRLSPVIPFNAINYVMAGTKISFRDYSLTLIGILPGTTTYVFIGATAGSIVGFNDDDDEDHDNGGTGKVIDLAALCVGIVLALVATFLLSVHARRRFLKLVEGTHDEEDDNAVLGPLSRELVSPVHRDATLACDVSKQHIGCSTSRSATSKATSLGAFSPSTSSFVDPEDPNVYM